MTLVDPYNTILMAVRGVHSIDRWKQEASWKKWRKYFFLVVHQIIYFVTSRHKLNRCVIVCFQPIQTAGGKLILMICRVFRDRHLSFPYNAVMQKKSSKSLKLLPPDVIFKS